MGAAAIISPRSTTAEYSVYITYLYSREWEFARGKRDTEVTQ